MVCLSTNGQDSAYHQLQIDTHYVEDFEESVTAQFYTIQKFTRFYFQDKERGRFYDYFPNETTNLGLGFHYKWLGLGLGINPSPRTDVDIKGRTRKIDLQAHSYGRQNVIDFNFSRYTGFYLSNPEQALIPWDSLVYPQRKDIRSTQLGITWLHFFNHKKFSYRAAFSHTEWQRKSAASWLVGAFGGFNNLRSNHGLPYPPFDEPISLEHPRRGTFTYGGIGGGFAGTLVIAEGFYTTLSLFLGVSAQINSVKEGTGRTVTEVRITGRNQSRLALGYNHPHFFIGIYGFTENQNLMNSDQYGLRNEYGFVRFFIGRRFG